MRRSLLAQREQFVGSAEFGPAAIALARHLDQVLQALEPDLLGLYWPQRGEFNAVAVPAVVASITKGAAALPFAERDPPRLHYRRWGGATPDGVDGYGIPSSSGAPSSPDVVLVPCLGHTRDGHRLGYGAGCFDRWLAAHPAVTAVGVAWQVGEITPADFDAQGHDLPLALVVTERGVVEP